MEVRAKVLGDAPIEAVEVSVYDADWAPMLPAGTTLWQVAVRLSARQITVRALDACGRRDQNPIELAEPGWLPPPRYRAGSDWDRVGA